MARFEGFVGGFCGGAVVVPLVRDHGRFGMGGVGSGAGVDGRAEEERVDSGRHDGGVYGGGCEVVVEDAGCGGGGAGVGGVHHMVGRVRILCAREGVC